MKTRQDVIGQCYLNIHDIQLLLKVSYPTAKRIYREAEGLQKLRFHERKVSMREVMKATGMNINMLMKQIQLDK